MNIHKEIKELREETISAIKKLFIDKSGEYAEIEFVRPVEGWIDGNFSKVNAIVNEALTDVAIELEASIQYDGGNEDEVCMTYKQVGLDELDLELLLLIRDALK